MGCGAERARARRATTRRGRVCACSIGGGGAGRRGRWSSARGRPGSPRPTSCCGTARPVRVLEADDVVGGISRTVERDGWRFDIGGHRFFTKVPRVEAFWHEILPDEDFLLRPRMSRIFYRGKLFDYPLSADERAAQPGAAGGGALRRLVRAGPGCARRRTSRTSRAGCRPASAGGSTRSSSRPTPRRSGACRPTEIQADWAAQRIKNLSLATAIAQRAAAPAQPHGRDQPDRGVPVPEVRAGDDVGALRRAGRRARRHGRTEHLGRPPCTATRRAGGRSA